MHIMSSKRKSPKTQARTAARASSPSVSLQDQTISLAGQLTVCIAIGVGGAAILRCAQLFELMPVAAAQIVGVGLVLLALGLGPAISGTITEKILPKRWWRFPAGVMIVITSVLFVQAGIYAGVQQLPTADEIMSYKSTMDQKK